MKFGNVNSFCGCALRHHTVQRNDLLCLFAVWIKRNALFCQYFLRFCQHFCLFCLRGFAGFSYGFRGKSRCFSSGIRFRFRTKGRKTNKYDTV